MAKKTAKKPAGHLGWNLIDGQHGFVILKDALHNLSASENGDEHHFGGGLLVGVVSALMASGMSFEKACELALQAAPDDIHPDRVPPSWIENFKSKIKK